MLIVVAEGPPVLLAQIVYVVGVIFTVGLPDISPLVNVNPDGRDGLISQVATNPPPIIGTMSVIFTPRVNTTVEGE